MNILKPYFIRLSVLCLLLVTSGNFSFAILDTKRFDAKATKRVNYLHYSNAGTLRFSEPEPSVDRGNLLVFIPVSRAATSPALNSEGNSTNLPEFPLVSYEDLDNNITTEPSFLPPIIQAPSSIMEGDDQALPLADPFEEMEGDVVNTDDLLEVFESYDDAPGTVAPRMALPFIPPYSVTPDNLTISSEATYRRVNR